MSTVLTCACPTCFRSSCRATSIIRLTSIRSGANSALTDAWLHCPTSSSHSCRSKPLPALAVNGNVDYHPGSVDGDFEITTRNGRLAGAGNWKAKTEAYQATVHLDDFPVDAFMPELGVGRVTATASVDGHGYNPMKRSTFVDARVNVDDIIYNKERYSDIALNASLSNGNATGELVSRNHDADASADFDADLHGDTVRWNLSSEIRNLNLTGAWFCRHP